jgi:heme-degrading monooxygenase HmoA
MNNPVVAINVYSVPKGKEEEFLMWWYEMKEGLIDVSGLISCRLHRSLDADAEFQFVNVVEWQNSLYSQAYENSISLMKAKLAQSGVEVRPAMFAVVAEYIPYR